MGATCEQSNCCRSEKHNIDANSQVDDQVEQFKPFAQVKFSQIEIRDEN